MAVAMAPGVGQQVVCVSAEHTYSLKEEVLRDILLRDDVKDLPVVVVSIAGAYRGGKSFILDYCLRYLQASPTQRESSAWLGEEKEVLKGFTWRGGIERETTGIHLWSEPIIVTLDSGEKVVVLLMDTQGTFDSESTIRDSTTIFALSTLISSVQIYNLTGNIKEDDLQNLQLFTRYGALARDEGVGGKAFQVLQFLVRDWRHPTHCPYGATGGEQLLNRRLEINDQQAQEIRALREELRDTFERLSCFLMPCPGDNITKQNFSGCLADLKEEFRTALLELVPSIFKTSNLTPKLINGERVKAKALFEYFKTYMQMFNSNELPEPTIILKAMSEAGLLAASRDSRELYELQMKQQCGGEQPSVTPHTLESLHRAALNAALAAFNNKKKLGSKEDCDTYLAQLTQELEECLPDFISSNNAKIRAAVTQAKETYEAKLNEVRGLNQLCLHPEDLNIFHRMNVEAVLCRFDLTRRLTADEVDSERIALVQHFKDLMEELTRTNEQNNEAAVLLSREAYIRSMESAFDNRFCVHARLLARNHRCFYNLAINTFMGRRNREFEHTVDDYKTQLIDSIESHFNRLNISNNNNSRTLVQTVMYTYNNLMASITNGNISLSSDELRRQHEAAKARALDDFQAGRLSDENDDDEVKTNLLRELEECFAGFVSSNDAKTRAAISQAKETYETQLTEVRGALQLCLHPEDFRDFHNINVQAILNQFDLTRRVAEGEDDSERIALVQYFENQLEVLTRTNEQNNEAAVRLSREAYIRSMESAFNNRLCVTARLLARNHHRFYNDALNTFIARRNRVSDHIEDAYKTQLINSIQTHFDRMNISNNNNSRTLVQTVIHNTYNNLMPSISNGTLCLHPEELRREHEAAKAQALEVFDSSRSTDAEDVEDDEFKTNLLTALENRYQQLVTQNETNNRLAIEAAVADYCRRMDQICCDSLLSYLNRPQIIRIKEKLPTYNVSYSKEAKLVFWSRRRNREEYEKDIYFEELKEKLYERYNEYGDIVETRAPWIGPPEEGTWADFWAKYPDAIHPSLQF